MKSILLALIAAAATGLATPGHGQSGEALRVGPDSRVQAYRLERVEVKGSTRLGVEEFRSELGLTRGQALDDDFVMSARQRILSFGLFKSVTLAMRKGSQRGWAVLVIEVEDDESVLFDWALGGELGVTYSEVPGAATGHAAPLGYRLGLVSRNLFHSLHRGAVQFDLGGDGLIRAAHFAYGLPKLSQEDLRFDTEIRLTDIRYRYLDALGFGGRFQALWTHAVAQNQEVQFGTAMYVNRPTRFGFENGYPSSLAGPKVGYVYESRLKHFYPEAGSRAALSGLYAPIKAHYSVIETNLAHTFEPLGYAWVTMGLDALAMGTKAYAVRAESVLEVPLQGLSLGGDQALVYVRLRSGVDEHRSEVLRGHAGVIGLRYHSSGLIADLSVEITERPDQFTKRTLEPLTENAR